MYVMGPALLVHNNWSSSFIVDSIFLHHVLKVKPTIVCQVLDGHLIEVTTIGILSLEQQKGGCGCLIEAAA